MKNCILLTQEDKSQEATIMHVKATYRPGQKGTQKLTRKYGDKLVCVRYRYDAFLKKRYKTIEIIIDESDWTPPPPHPRDEDYFVKTKTENIHRNFNEQVAIKAGWGEKELQQRVKAIGGIWALKKNSGTQKKTQLSEPIYNIV